MLFHRKEKNIKKRRDSSVLVIPLWQTSLRKRDQSICERAVLCTSGSLTCEAAVVLPLFFLALLTLICVIDACRIFTVKQGELAESAKKTGTYAYMAEEYLDEYIDLSYIYPYELPVSLIPNYTLNMAIRARVHTWTGRSDAECAADREREGTKMVYVTENRSVYHTDSSCSHLELAIYAVGESELSAKRNNDGRRYGACEKCCGDTAGHSVYYIAESGDCYHASRNCSGLTRHVALVKESDAAHLKPCSRCEGGEKN